MEAKDPTMQELRTLVESASHDNPHLTTRLEKAAFLVLLRRIAVTGHNRYKVALKTGLGNMKLSTATASATTILDTELAIHANID